MKTPRGDFFSFFFGLGFFSSLGEEVLAAASSSDSFACFLVCVTLELQSLCAEEAAAAVAGEAVGRRERGRQSKAGRRRRRPR